MNAEAESARPKPEERCAACGQPILPGFIGQNFVRLNDGTMGSMSGVVHQAGFCPIQVSSSVAESKADRKSPSASRETEVPGTGTTADNQATENRECEANSEALKTFDFPPGTWCNQHIQPISACVQIARLRDDVERLTTEAEEAYDAGFAVGYGFGYSAARRALGEKP